MYLEIEVIVQLKIMSSIFTLDMVSKKAEILFEESWKPVAEPLASKVKKKQQLGLWKSGVTGFFKM